MQINLDSRCKHFGLKFKTLRTFNQKTRDLSLSRILYEIIFNAALFISLSVHSLILKYFENWNAAGNVVVCRWSNRSRASRIIAKQVERTPRKTDLVLLLHFAKKTKNISRSLLIANMSYYHISFVKEREKTRPIEAREFRTRSSVRLNNSDYI